MAEIELKKRYKYAGDVAKELTEHSDWGLESIIEFLNSIKDADVVEVKHGEWIEDGYDDSPCVCSICGAEAPYVSKFDEMFDYDWEENLQYMGYEEIREYIRTPYCPNCGAKMDGGKTE